MIFNPVRFFMWILSAAFMLGLAGGLVDLTMSMAKSAAHAHQHDQLSYGKFSRMLWEHPNSMKVPPTKDPKRTQSR